MATPGSKRIDLREALLRKLRAGDGRIVLSGKDRKELADMLKFCYGCGFCNYMLEHRDQF